MRHARPTLPALTVNRQFMVEFTAAEPPCLGLGLVEVEGSQCALVALHLNQTLPPEVSAAGFAFGHAVFGGEGWEVVHFAFEFYGFATYNVLINPSDPVARLVLNKMVETGDYFFFALTGNRRVTAFRSAIAEDNLAGLKANMARTPGIDHQRRPIPPDGIPVREAAGAAWNAADLGLPAGHRLSRSVAGPAGVESSVSEGRERTRTSIVQPMGGPDAKPPCQPLDVVDAIRLERRAPLSCRLGGVTSRVPGFSPIPA